MCRCVGAGTNVGRVSGAAAAAARTCAPMCPRPAPAPAPAPLCKSVLTAGSRSRRRRSASGWRACSRCGKGGGQGQAWLASQLVAQAGAGTRVLPQCTAHTGQKASVGNVGNAAMKPDTSCSGKSIVEASSSHSGSRGTSAAATAAGGSAAAQARAARRGGAGAGYAAEAGYPRRRRGWRAASTTGSGEAFGPLPVLRVGCWSLVTRAGRGTAAVRHGLAHSPTCQREQREPHHATVDRMSMPVQVCAEELWAPTRDGRVCMHAPPGACRPWAISLWQCPLAQNGGGARQCWAAAALSACRRCHQGAPPGTAGSGHVAALPRRRRRPAPLLGHLAVPLQPGTTWHQHRAAPHSASQRRCPAGARQRAPGGRRHRTALPGTRWQRRPPGGAARAPAPSWRWAGAQLTPTNQHRHLGSTARAPPQDPDAIAAMAERCVGHRCRSQTPAGGWLLLASVHSSIS